jgi:undecaprenyl-diphosphatase
MASVDSRSWPRDLWLVAAAWLIVAILFATMAVSAREHRNFAGDSAVSEEVQEMSFPGLGALEQLADVIGSKVMLVLVAPGLAAWFAIRRRAYFAGLAASVVVLPGSGLVVKLLVERPRPSAPLVQVREHASGFSFPSGHALQASMLCALVLLAASDLSPGWARRLLMVLAPLAALLIGFERVYDGAHWTSDVIGGFLLGAIVMVPPTLIAPVVLEEWRDSRSRGDHSPPDVIRKTG